MSVQKEQGNDGETANHNDCRVRITKDIGSLFYSGTFIFSKFSNFKINVEFEKSGKLIFVTHQSLPVGWSNNSWIIPYVVQQQQQQQGRGKDGRREGETKVEISYCSVKTGDWDGRGDALIISLFVVSCN